MTDDEILKEAMINLIKKSFELKENFVFEKLQEYMDLSDPLNPKWTENVRIRMLEIHEAREDARKEERKRIKEIIEEKEKKYEGLEELQETQWVLRTLQWLKELLLEIEEDLKV